MAGVGATTVKQGQKLKKEDPEKFEEVVQGKNTTKKALKEVKAEKEKKEKEKAQKDNDKPSAKPTISELLAIVHRALGMAEEADKLAIKSNAVLFTVNGHRIKVTCKIM